MKIWEKCHPGADQSFKHSSKWFLKMLHWRSLTSFDSLTCIGHQLIYLNYSWISIFQQHHLSGKRLLYVYNPFQVWKVTLTLIIRDQMKKSEVTVHTSFKNVLDFNYLNAQLLSLEIRVLFCVCVSLYGKWSIPFHLRLYWNVQYLLKMWSFTGRLLKIYENSFGGKSTLKTPGTGRPERPKILTFHVFGCVLLFKYRIDS